MKQGGAEISPVSEEYEGMNGACPLGVDVRPVRTATLLAR